MRFKDYIKESIIDIPRSTYARPVFDKADTDNPVLKPSVRKQLLDGIKQFERFGKVVNHTLIGSILTKRYRDDADLDVNILFKIPGSKAQQEKVHEKIREHQWEANGEKVGDSNHIINYFSIIDPAIFSRNRAMADGTFDISDNKFIRKPKGDSFDAEKYVADFQHKVAEIDVIRGELKRDMIDYKELQGLSAKDVDNLSQLVAKKLSEIKDSIKSLIDMGDKVMQDRADAFNTPMSPDDIRKFGVQHKLPKNVIYKMLEKYHYLNFYKHLVEIMKDGKITPDELKSLSKITEARGRHIAFTFGRFNPPTIGHEKLLNKVAAQRADQYIIYLSRSEDSAKNPLAFREKVAVMKRMFPRHAGKIAVSNSNKVFDILIELYKKKFTEITMVVGSDRVREFDTIIKRYNGDKNKHGYYNFDRISVVSAGERDPDAEGAMGMSASKMRDAASKNDLVSFKRGLPISYRDKDGLFKLVRKGMNLENMSGAGLGTYAPSADINPTAKRKVIVEKFTQWQIRDLYIREQLFNKNDIVNDIEQEVTGKVIRRSTNYIVLEDNQSNLHKCWIWNCLPVSNVDEVKLHEHNLDVDYGFEAVSETEVKMSKQKTYEDIKKREESYEIGKDYANHTKEITPGETPSEKPVDSKTRAEQSAEKISAKDIQNWASASETIDKYKTRYGEDWEKELDEATNKMEERLKVQSFKEFNNSQGD